MDFKSFYNEKKRMILTIVVGSFVIGLGFGLIHHFTAKKSEVQAMVKRLSDDTLQLSDDAIKNLTLKKVSLNDFPEELSIMGRVSVPEDRVAVVSARVAGRVQAVYVASGEMVTAGQPMVSIFSPDYVVAREEYLETVKSLKENPEDGDAKRLVELSKKKLDSIGSSMVDVNAARKTASEDNQMVRAPRGGALLDKKAVVGAFVNPGDTLFTVGDMSKVWFVGDVYLEDVAKVHKDQDVQIDQATGQPLHGKISFISPVVDPNTRTIKVRALIDNPNSDLRADMYMKGNIILSQHTALVAPKSALIRLRDSQFSFVRLPNNIFKKVEITIGAETNGLVAIKTGLKDGDEVVSEGALLLDAALTGEGSG